jgi:hypothetical protein
MASKYFNNKSKEVRKVKAIVDIQEFMYFDSEEKMKMA